MLPVETNRLAWTAPEVVSLAQLTVLSDAWAFGVLGWEILTLGATPFYDGIGIWLNNTSGLRYVLAHAVEFAHLADRKSKHLRLPTPSVVSPAVSA